MNSALTPRLLFQVLAVLALAADTVDAAEGGGGAMQYFTTSLWGVLVFIIVLLILWKKAYPPIIEALDRREATIRDSLEAAERAKAEAERVMAQHAESLEKSRAEARAIIEESKSDAEKVKASIVESARKEAEEISSRARRDIELAKKAAIDELYRSAGRLAIDIASKVVAKDLKPEDHESLVDACVQEAMDYQDLSRRKY